MARLWLTRRAVVGAAVGEAGTLGSVAAGCTAARRAGPVGHRDGARQLHNLRSLGQSTPPHGPRQNSHIRVSLREQPNMRVSQ